LRSSFWNEVDVNVHPSKTEVRFRHQTFVHDFVRETIRERLMESRPAPAFPVTPAAQPAVMFSSGDKAVSPAQPAAQMPYSDFSAMIENQGLIDAPSQSIVAGDGDIGVQPESGEPRMDSAAPEFHLRPGPTPQPRFDFSGHPLDMLAEPSEAGTRLRVPDTHGEFPAEAMAVASTSLSALSDLRPLGQIHDSFIIAAGRDGLWIIDQHVAHERILFEKVLKQRAAGAVEVQRLLMPLILQLTPEQQIEYARIADELQSMGFETEPFGNRTIAVKAAPAAIGPGDLEKVLFEVLEISESELRRASLDDVRRAIAASIACRAAIKINMRLDPTKMEWLLRSLSATDCPMSCPHGRPIALQYSMREILKAFHRI